MPTFRRVAQAVALTGFGALAASVYFAPSHPAGGVAPPALATVLPEDPGQRSTEMLRLIECSARRTCPADALDTTPCNPKRHVTAAHIVTKHGFLISGVQWVHDDMVTFIGSTEPRFNIALGCDQRRRGITLRPFVATNATDPAAVAMMSEVIAADFHVDARKIGSALTACFADGTPYEKNGIKLWCHSPTSKIGPTGDYRVFAFSSVRDAER